MPSTEDAEGIVQQTAVVLWKKFDEYDPQQPFTPWACRFALNVAKQWIAGRKRWNRLLDAELADELLRRRDELSALMDQRLAHLQKCMDKLARADRSLIDEYYSRRSSVRGMSRQLGRSADAIYKDLQRIRSSLRRCIENASQREVEES